MLDPIYRDFLQLQHDQGLSFAANSDLVDLEPYPDPRAQYDGVPSAYIAKFYGKGIVCRDERTFDEATEFHIGIAFRPDHLRRVNPFELVTWLWPHNIWHPNIRPPLICLGHSIPPGYEMVPLLHQIYEIISYQNRATHSYLNEAAAEWARNNEQRLPVDRRPLKRIKQAS
jgi:hypothetical protein